MSRRNDTELVADEVQKNLPPDLALLFAAIRSEFDAKLGQSESRLLMRLAFLGIPLGAMGGFAAEMVRPGSPARVGQVALSILPFL